jgi:non-ribosomal peptide synthetase component F
MFFSAASPTSLTKILFAGEAMPNKHLNHWRKITLHCIPILSGPTEVTVIANFLLYCRSSFKDDESLPIGKACKNTKTLISFQKKV